MATLWTLTTILLQRLQDCWTVSNTRLRLLCPVQVAAFYAIVDLVRGQHVGVFDHKLFVSAITAVLQSADAGDEVLQVLLHKYIPYADVR